MNDDALVLGMAAVFAGLTVVLVALAAAVRSAVPLVVALAFAVATYVFWYHATGEMRERIAERARRRRANGGRARGRRRRGASNAGPREDWAPPGGWERWERREARDRRRAGGRTDPEAPTGRPDGPTAAEARRVLGVDGDADEATVREAYRERVKEVHPDRGGDEEAFKRVTDAYERLTDSGRQR